MANQKIAFSGVAALLVCMLLLSIWSLVPSDNATAAAEQDSTAVEQIAKAPTVVERQNDNLAGWL